MASTYYNRYKSFIDGNGNMSIVPFISIPAKSTDKYTYYEEGKTRFDILSYQYYGDPNFGWLILEANPELGSLEYRIPNNSQIRIPYPLSSTIVQYEQDIKVYVQLYGLTY
jgi:hypothetical protein